MSKDYRENQKVVALFVLENEQVAVSSVFVPFNNEFMSSKDLQI
jgi:hypothetical protein